jgi:hypothetical protein
MAPMRAARLVCASACLLTAGALVAIGCGGDSGSTDVSTGSSKPAPSRPAPSPN